MCSSDLNFSLLRRGKRYDYFTSCLPFPQKGPDVTLPLGTSAPVLGIGKSSQSFVSGTQSVWQSDGSNPTWTSTAEFDPGNAAGRFYALGHNVGVNAVPNIYADLTEATAATINDLRLAFQTQKLYERDARGGTRYTEIIKSHFGVISPDMRLQRPEYLGGGSTPVIINPVAQTSATSGSNALGDLAAYGVCAPQGHGFTYSATEHCWVIG